MADTNGAGEERGGVSPENTWSAPRGSEAPGDEPDRAGRIAEAARREEFPRRGMPWPQEVAIRLGCAAAGGVLGYLAFWGLLSQGLYALAIPGGLLGIGAGMYARRRSMALGVVCGVAALVLGLMTFWSFSSYGLADFFRNLHRLSTFTYIMLAIGTLVGYWGGRGR